MKNRVLVCIGLTLLTAVGVSVANRWSEGPSLVPAAHDLGTIDEHGLQNLTFTVRNVSRNAVSIDKLVSSCGCLSVEPSRMTIPGKSQGVFHLKLDGSYLASKYGLNDHPVPLAKVELTPFVAGRPTAAWTVTVGIRRSAIPTSHGVIDFGTIDSGGDVAARAAYSTRGGAKILSASIVAVQELRAGEVGVASDQIETVFTVPADAGGKVFDFELVLELIVGGNDRPESLRLPARVEIARGFVLDQVEAIPLISDGGAVSRGVWTISSDAVINNIRVKARGCDARVRHDADGTWFVDVTRQNIKAGFREAWVEIVVSRADGREGADRLNLVSFVDAKDS